MRASASERPVTRAQALQTRANSSGVAPASPQVAYRALLERYRARPKKVGRLFGPRPPRTGEGRKRAKERGVRFGRPRSGSMIPWWRGAMISWRLKARS